jgi:hypothetical protein
VVANKIYPRELNNALPFPSNAAGLILAYFTIVPVNELNISKFVGMLAEL